MPLSYIPSYVDRDIQVIRRIVPQLRAIPDHALRDITVYVRGFDLPELRGRPLIGVRWHDDKFDMVDGRRLADDVNRPYFLLWRATLPAGMTETYVVGCGKTTLTPPAPDDKGIRLSFDYTCRGLYSAIVCTKTDCWLGGTTWR